MPRARSIFSATRKAASSSLMPCCCINWKRSAFSSGSVIAIAVPPSLYLAMAMTEPEEKAERFQLMQQHGISELDAAFRVAEKVDRARGIEPLALDTLA